jgi:hypothetical protein
MTSSWKVLPLMVLMGCGTPGGPYPPATASAAPPASAKWEGPWMPVPGGQWKAALYYGPWQCNRRLMDSCQVECAGQGYALKGCMWLADMKLDWKGQIVPPIRVDSGGRLALSHCCCDYPRVSPMQNRALREQWKNQTKTLRKRWGEKFGEWPKGGQDNWPGHHLRDLFHGGEPTDLNNILPTPTGTHGVFNEQYPICYAGGSPWNAVGPDLPYSDQ